MSENREFRGTGVVRRLKDQLVPTLGTRLMTFELEQTNKNDGRVRHISVQMEGLGFRGAISNGHTVDVEGTLRNGTVISNRLINKSVNGCVVEPRTSSPIFIKLFKGIAITALASFALIICLFIYGISTFFG